MRNKAIRSSVLALVTLYVLVFLGGTVATGLYVALFVLSEPAMETVASVTTPAPQETEKESVKKRPARAEKQPAPSRTRPAQPETSTPGKQPPVNPDTRRTRSEAFRKARQAILRQGEEPDWKQFEGREKEILEKVWERYQRKKGSSGG